MVLTFWCSKGLINTNSVPRGTMVHTNHMVEAVFKFLLIFKPKMFIMAAVEWFLCWGTALVLSAAD